MERKGRRNGQKATGYKRGPQRETNKEGKRGPHSGKGRDESSEKTSRGGFRHSSGDDSGDRRGFRGKKQRGKFRPQRSKKQEYISPEEKGEAKKDLFKDGELRLNRYIANSGTCSRREADELITGGKVLVNGEVVKELGTRVKLKDKVEVNGKRIDPERKVYVLLNKPKGYVTTMDDPEGRQTVMDIVGGACDERIYPVGRLDRATTGVLLFTNDGELTKRLTHPKYKKKKVYNVVLDKPLTKNDMIRIAEGFELEDGFIAADGISYVGEDKSEIGVELHSGRNRIVRRIFEHFGYQIEKLDRVYFAGLTKKGLNRGHWRFLSEREIYLLKMNAFM